MAILLFLGYAINLNNTGGGLGREMVYSFLSLGLARCIAGLSLGCLIRFIIEEFQKHYRIDKETPKASLFIKIAATAIEVICIFLLIRVFLFTKSPWSNTMVVVVLFSIFFIVVISKRGLITNLLNRPLFSFLGRYSYAIYVMQQESFYLMQKTIWQNTSFVTEHVYLCLFVSVLFSVVIGVLTYHLVEDPCMKLYRNWKRKYMSFDDARP